MEDLTEGRIVHYVLPDGPHKGEHRPAIVVKVWQQGDGTPPTNGYSNLNDVPNYSGAVWATSVTHSDDHEPRTWHWIEKA